MSKNIEIALICFVSWSDHHYHEVNYSTAHYPSVCHSSTAHYWFFFSRSHRDFAPKKSSYTIDTSITTRLEMGGTKSRLHTYISTVHGHWALQRIGSDARNTGMDTEYGQAVA